MSRSAWRKKNARKNERFVGGGKETRTPDPYAASVMLYQLSYAPIGLRPPRLGPLHGAKCDSSVSGGLACSELLGRPVVILRTVGCHPERSRRMKKAVTKTY